MGVTLDRTSTGHDGTVFEGGDSMKNEGTWCAISSFGFSGARNVSMPMGKQQGIIDAGMQGFSAVGITKELDEFSEILLSRLIAPKLNPGVKPKNIKPGKFNIGGDTYSIIVVCAAAMAMRVILQLTLMNCHLITYNVGGSNGSMPFESLQLAYSRLDIQYSRWLPDNSDFKAGGSVSYDLPSNEAISYYKNKG